MSAADKGTLDKLRAGDRSACERFVREHYQGLYGWLYRLSGCRHGAEDLTQESFAAFWESLRRTTPHVGARTWLYSIARNQWRKHCRSRGAARQREIDDLDAITASDPSPSASLEQREFADALEAAMDELSAELREVFSLRRRGLRLSRSKMAPAVKTRLRSGSDSSTIPRHTEAPREWHGAGRLFAPGTMFWVARP